MVSPSPPGATVPPRRLTPEDMLNVRDIMSAFAGQGYKGTQNDDARSMYSYLRGIVGPDTAQKLLLHLSIHNQRPDMANASPEKRIQSLYEIGSRDPEVNDLLGRAKMVAQGPMAGINETPLALTQLQQGKQMSLGTRPPASPASIAGLGNAAGAIR